MLTHAIINLICVQKMKTLATPRVFEELHKTIQFLKLLTQLVPLFTERYD